MAQKVNIVLVDDIDGGDATETVRFALDGVNYEIDLSDDHARELRSSLEPYVKGGRKSGGRTTTRGRTATPKNQDIAAIRTWARDNGYQVSSRGRIQGEIVEAYLAAKGA